MRGLCTSVEHWERCVDLQRYHRQFLLLQVGVEGQEKLARSRVLLVGCGALGSVIAEQLVRAGVGTLRLVDRDLVELSNLQRQVLFDEQDAAEQAPKAVAAARRLARINSQVAIEPIVADVNPDNVERLAGVERGERSVDLIIDGTDNVETRYLLNDVSVKHGIPWIYGAAVGTEGRCMAIRPGTTACLRCLFREAPAPAELPTCDTAGVLASASSVVASIQATHTLQILLGHEPPALLTSFDIWTGRFRTISTAGARDPDCITCVRKHFEFLDNRAVSRSASLCGRNAIQVRPARDIAMDLTALAQRLSTVGETERTPYLLRCKLWEPRDVRLTVFTDGRAIVHGVIEPDRARAIYARFIGN
jgi:molybdopterin/thiamine biosynthesis adenylyltransferase